MPSDRISQTGPIPAPPSLAETAEQPRAIHDPPPQVERVPQPEEPRKRVVAQRGWRRWVYRFTRINLGLSREEKHDLDLRTRIRRNPTGSYEIAVIGLKGGVGKTTLTAALGSTLAQVRADRILALDADPGCGNLAERAGHTATGTIANLLTRTRVSHYNDVRAHTGVNAMNLEVLSAEDYAAARHSFSQRDWRITTDAVAKFYNLVLADCGAGMLDPATSGVLATASAVVIVSSVSIDSARQTDIALEWLHNNGYRDLLGRACLVLNHVTPGETNIAVKELIRHFESQVQPGRIVVLPWDRHIAAGTEIRLDRLDPIYKRGVLELAAALSDDFGRAGRR